MASTKQVEVPRFPIEAHAIKKSKYVMLKGHPCKIMEVKTSKTGKHGHMKCNITGIDVLTGRKYTDVVPGHAPMVEFKLEKNEYQLIDIKDTEIYVLDSANAQRVIKIDTESETYKKMKDAFEKQSSEIKVTVIRAPVETAKDKFNDEEQVENFKEEKAD